MCTASRGALPGLATFFALFLLVATTMGAWDYSYCSPQNTGSDFPAFYWDYQSNGKCHDHCGEQGSYAFAVLQQNNCWCSNYIPEKQTKIGDCTGTCPGFPSEKCGNAGQLYIYVKLDGTPSGTAGASTPSSTDVSSSSSEARSSTRPPPEASTSPSSKPSSTLQTTTSTRDDRPTSVAPQTSVLTVTEGSVVVTKTQIYSPIVTPQPEVSGKSSTNTGAIVGGVVGGVGFLAAIIAGVLFLLWRRRKQQRSEEGGEPGEPGVQRYASTMSKAGLLRTEKEPQYPPHIATSFNKRHSRTLDQDSISPISASDRRNSSFRGVDQRLNPSTLFVFDNSSRGSVGSLDDSRDYHRTLNVRNPDTQ